MIPDWNAYVFYFMEDVDIHVGQIVTLRDGIWMPPWPNGGGLFFGRFTRQTYFMCVLHYTCAHFTYLSNLKSLALGRPPSIDIAYVDCGLPKAQGDSDTEHQCRCGAPSFLHLLMD